MSAILTVFSKSFRQISTGSFPQRLGDGVSLPPWSWRGGAVAAVVSLASFSAVRELLELAWGLQPNDVFFPGLVFSIPTLCCLVYLARRAGTTVGKLFGLRGTRVGQVLGSGVVLFLLETCLAVGTGVVLAGMGCEWKPEAPVSSVLTRIDMVIWAPICEELSIRGLLYTSLRARFGVAPSTVITAVTFALLHAPCSPQTVAILFVSALLSSVWYERTRSLWPNIISHSLNNLI